MVFSFSVYAAGEVEYVWLTVSNAMSGEPIEGVSITVDQAYIGETGPLGRKRRIELRQQHDPPSFI